jgi:hypothetical protein
MTILTAGDRYAYAAQEDRSAPRIRLSIPALLRQSGDRPLATVVKDLSLSGFSCEAVTGMRMGALCWLTLPGLAALPAEVMRNDQGLVGCAFTNLLNPAVHASIVARWA